MLDHLAATLQILYGVKWQSLVIVAEFWQYLFDEITIDFFWGGDLLLLCWKALQREYSHHSVSEVLNLFGMAGFF